MWSTRSILSRDSLSLSNDSQLTLIDGSHSSTTQLVFTAWNRILSTGLLKGGQPVYKVATNDPSYLKTVLSDSTTGETLAKINRSSFSKTGTKGKVTLRNGESVKIRSWLREGKLENGWDKWTMSTVSGDAIWKYDQNLRLVLHMEGDLTNPLAWVQVASDGPPAQASLILRRGTEPFHVEIITSFLILEHKLRMQGKKYKSTDCGALWSVVNTNMLAA